MFWSLELKWTNSEQSWRSEVRQLNQDKSYAKNSKLGQMNCLKLQVQKHISGNMCGTNIVYLKGTTLNLYLSYHFTIILTPINQTHCIYHLTSHNKTILVNMLILYQLLIHFAFQINQFEKKNCVNFQSGKMLKLFWLTQNYDKLDQDFSNLVLAPAWFEKNFFSIPKFFDRQLNQTKTPTTSISSHEHLQWLNPERLMQTSVKQKGFLKTKKRKRKKRLIPWGLFIIRVKECNAILKKKGGLFKS